jgi:hypothetical protein
MNIRIRINPDIHPLDRSINVLQAHNTEWARLPNPEKMAHLEELQQRRAVLAAWGIPSSWETRTDGGAGLLLSPPAHMVPRQSGFLPKPPRFVTDMTTHTSTRSVTHITDDPCLRYIPAIFTSALAGQAERNLLELGTRVTIKSGKPTDLIVPV